MPGSISLPELAVTMAKPSEARAILVSGKEGIATYWENMDPALRQEVEDARARLQERGVGLLMRDDREFPERLRR